MAGRATTAARVVPAIPTEVAQQCPLNRDGRHKAGHDEAEVGRALLGAGPGLAAAEHAAEGAALHAQRVRTLERDVRRIDAAAADVLDLAVPAIVAAGLHVDENPVVRLAVGEAAQGLAARLDADLAVLLLGDPHADRARG